MINLERRVEPTQNRDTFVMPQFAKPAGGFPWSLSSTLSFFFIRYVFIQYTTAFNK